jgi:hypothetical protein
MHDLFGALAALEVAGENRSMPVTLSLVEVSEPW